MTLGFSVGLMSMQRTWSLTDESIFYADQDAYLRLQEQGHDPIPNYLQPSTTPDFNMCTEFQYLSLPADSSLCR